MSFCVWANLESGKSFCVELDNGNLVWVCPNLPCLCEIILTSFILFDKLEDRSAADWSSAPAEFSPEISQIDEFFVLLLLLSLLVDCEVFIECGNETSRDPHPLFIVLLFCLFVLFSSLFRREIGTIDDYGSEAFFLSMGYLNSSRPVISDIRGFPGSSFLCVELRRGYPFLQEAVPAPPWAGRTYAVLFFAEVRASGPL